MKPISAIPSTTGKQTFPLRTSGAVSYTHLDVYKRQGMQRWKIKNAQSEQLLMRCLAFRIFERLPACMDGIGGFHFCLLYTSARPFNFRVVDYMQQSLEAQTAYCICQQLHTNLALKSQVILLTVSTEVRARCV